jgi:hypothetical protein
VVVCEEFSKQQSKGQREMQSELRRGFSVWVVGFQIRDSRSGSRGSIKAGYQVRTYVRTTSRFSRLILVKSGTITPSPTTTPYESTVQTHENISMEAYTTT